MLGRRRFLCSLGAAAVAMLGVAAALCVAALPAAAQGAAFKPAAKQEQQKRVGKAACQGQRLGVKRKRACRVAQARRRKAARRAAQRKRAALRRAFTRAPGGSKPPSSPEPALPGLSRALTESHPVPQEVLPTEDLTPPELPPLERPCHRVRGDCSIYSDLFWELLATYERFEIAVGTYPYHPNCLEAWERGQGLICATVIVHLYPDGTLGSGSWAIDPDSPAGWSRCVFDGDMNGPEACKSSRFHQVE